MPLHCSWDWLVNTSKAPMGADANLSFRLNSYGCLRVGKNEPMPFWRMGCSKISANAPVPGNSQHIYHFEARCSLLGFIFTHLDICDVTGSLSPHGYKYVQNRTSANICRPKHRMLTLILRGEGWSQGDPSHLGRSVTHMQHLPTYHAARIPTGILTGVYGFMGGLYSRKFTHHTDHYLV